LPCRTNQALIIDTGDSYRRGGAANNSRNKKQTECGEYQKRRNQIDAGESISTRVISGTMIGETHLNHHANKWFQVNSPALSWLLKLRAARVRFDSERVLPSNPQR